MLSAPESSHTEPDTSVPMASGQVSTTEDTEQEEGKGKQAAMSLVSGVAFDLLLVLSM